MKDALDNTLFSKEYGKLSIGADAKGLLLEKLRKDVNVSNLLNSRFLDHM